MAQQETIKIKPFNAKKHRHQMPFKKGQGVSLAGWQFEVKSCQANGTLNLKCRGKIIEQSEFAMVPKGGVPPVTNEMTIKDLVKTQKILMGNGNAKKDNT